MSSSPSGTPSSYLPINPTSLAAPTPQNTPLNPAPITAGLSRPTVPDISEDAEDDEPSKNAAAKQAILGLVQGKLAHLVGKSSGYIESLPVSVKRRVEGLKGVQAEYAKIERQHKLEILELDRKYLALYNPVFKRRQDILLGNAEPTAEEITAGEEVSLKDNPEATPLPAKDEDGAKVKGIPQFWLTALRNHVGINELITERDEGALRHLIDIRYEYLEPPKPGFRLLFYFSPNEYFEESVLTKEYVYQDEIGYGGDFIYDRAIGCTIRWKEDKDLTKEVEIKRQRNKNTNRTRVIKRTHPTASFFNFFNPPIPPTEEEEDEDEDPTELEELEERLELDYQIGEDIKERIIPHAVDYFTGKALEYEGLSDIDDEDDDDFEDEDGEDFDDDDDEDDDDDDEEPVRKTKGAKAAASGEGNVDPQECKQQ